MRFLKAWARVHDYLTTTASPSCSDRQETIVPLRLLIDHDGPTRPLARPAASLAAIQSGTEPRLDRPTRPLVC